MFLLPAKVFRALCTLCGPDSGDDSALCDAVAQLAICRKAVENSEKAFKSVAGKRPGTDVAPLLDLLSGLRKHVSLLENKI